MNLTDILQQAITHHQDGELKDAEQLYRSILTEEPKHPDANHNLGVLLKQGDQVDIALSFLKTALESNPNQGQFWISYIDTLIHLGQLDVASSVLEQGQSKGLKGDAVDQLVTRLNSQPKATSTTQSPSKAIKPERLLSRAKSHAKRGEIQVARELYTQVLEAYPQNQQAKKGLKSLQNQVNKKNPSGPPQAQVDSVISFYYQGRVQEALSGSETLIKDYPNIPLLYSLSGACYKALGQLDDAVKRYEQTLAIKPDYADAHYNLGNALQELGQLDAAVKCFEQALAIKPDYASAYNNLGNTLKELGQLDTAVKCYKQALAIKPDYAETQCNLGVTLQELGQLDAAVKCYKQALAIKSDYADAHYNLGNTLKELGQLDAAVKCYEQALAINPDYADAHNNLGNALQELGQLDAAVKCFEQALALKPGYAGAHNNLGNALQELGQLDAAVSCYKQALVIKPDYAEAHSNRLFLFNYSSNYDSDFLLKEAIKFGEIFRKKVTTHFSRFNCSNKPNKLKIGLVSGDFKEHPVGYFLESVLPEIAQQNLELIAYSSHPKFDELSARIQLFFSEWKPLYGLSDENAAKLIHNDGVHILMDLSGCTAHNRLPIFTWKPAPIQISWLGYFATTGIYEIDYILGDPYVTPAQFDSQFSEKIYRLPKTRWCFTPPKVNIKISPPPALTNGYVTFGCFNNLTKVNEQVISLWIKILAAIPNTRLLLKSKQLNSLSIQSKIIKKFTTAGIGPERIICEGAELREKYLIAYQRIDIALDPFPFTGGATTMESLWMGVPVLTLQGESLVSRQGVGILMNADLSNWIAKDKDEYLTKAINFSSDINRLSLIRSGLRDQVLMSPLFDNKQFSKDFENALWTIWQQRNFFRETSG